MLPIKGVSEDDLPDLPTQVTFLISGSNTKQIVVTPKSVMRVIANADSSFLANLTDIGDDRVALVYYKDDIADASAGLEFTIKPTNDKMLILGYKCKKYEIAILNKESKEQMTDIVYATEAIGGADINFLMYKGLKGFILRSEKTNGGETTIMEAKRVLKRPILDSEFLVPEVYTVTTYKEQKDQTNR
ncbi:MAG: hypothetical protein P4L28_07120 [Paludibacteraceae bacterium]|nr:hypothetical protein [Paludibacteraceae bacterium]